MLKPYDWTFKTKVIIVCDSRFRKAISIVIIFHCHNQPLTELVSIVCWWSVGVNFKTKCFKVNKSEVTQYIVNEKSLKHTIMRWHLSKYMTIV